MMQTRTSFARVQDSFGWFTDSYPARDPRRAILEFREILSYAKKRCDEVALFAVSLGAWLGLQSFRDEKLNDFLFYRRYLI